MLVQKKALDFCLENQSCDRRNEQVPTLFCDSYMHVLRQLCPPHLMQLAIWGGNFAHREQNILPKYLGNKSEIAHLNFIISPPPLDNFGLQHQVRNPYPSNPSFPYR